MKLVFKNIRDYTIQKTDKYDKSNQTDVIFQLVTYFVHHSSQQKLQPYTC